MESLISQYEIEGFDCLILSISGEPFLFTARSAGLLGSEKPIGAFVEEKKDCYTFKGKNRGEKIDKYHWFTDGHTLEEFASVLRERE